METLHPSYQTWIVENLLLGVATEAIKATLVNLGASSELAESEVTTAQNHPYVAAAMRCAATLQKREGLLKTLDFYQRQNPDYLRLKPRILPNYADFLRDYLAFNRPGFFTGAIDHWAARHWTPKSVLKKVGAKTIVEVQSGRSKEPEYEVNGQKLRRKMPFGEFISLIETTEGNDTYMTANNKTLDTDAFSVLTKDVSDIGNGYIDMRAMQQRLFLWIGPAGTITPMHHDLTHNLFFQIYGRKRFRLYPALQTPYMYNHTWVYSPTDPLNPDPAKYPFFAQAAPIDITVGPGDMLYIPIGWWHHVVSESTSISVSLTNLRGIANQFIGYPTSDTYVAY